MGKDTVHDFTDETDRINFENDPELLSDFIVETREHLENIEINALSLESVPENMETVHALFRSFHAIKGLAGFVNQNIIRDIAHHTEKLLDDCRKGNLSINKVIVDMILDSADLIKRICDCIGLLDNELFSDQIKMQAKNIEKRIQILSSKNVSDRKMEIGITESEQTMKIGSIWLIEGKINEEDLNKLLDKQQKEYPKLKLGEIAVKEKKMGAKEVIESLRKQENIKTAIEHAKLSYKILIIDGETAFLNTMKKVLEIEGYTVDVFENPIEALKQFKSNKYHIVLMNIVFDGVDGIEIMKELKKIDALTQVIVISGNETIEKIVECLEAGANDYLLKPVKSTEHVKEVVNFSIRKLERWKEVIREIVI